MKKRKGSSLPSDLVLSSSKAPVIETMVEVMVPLNLGVAPQQVCVKLQGKEEGLVMVGETQGEVNEALASAVEFMM